MAELFIKQAKQYALARPSYPQELFNFISSKTPNHHLVWDVGTGSGQAAKSLAEIYEDVVATDTSPTQLEFAVKVPNITYKHTPLTMSMVQLEQTIGQESSVDLVTVAQALHWFDLPTFYQQVKWILKKPNGVIAAWCYTTPEVSRSVDSVFQRFYTNSGPYWDPVRKLVDQRYETIDFPFEPIDGLDHNGPFRFDSKKLADFDGFMTYLRSWSAYTTAKEKGVELLSDDVIGDFKNAWNENGEIEKVITFPVYLKIGKVGSSSN